MAPGVNLLAPKLPAPRFAVGDLVGHRASGERAIVAEHFTMPAAENVVRKAGRRDGWAMATFAWNGGDQYGALVYIGRLAVAPTFSDGTESLKSVAEDELRLIERARDARRPQGAAAATIKVRTMERDLPRVGNGA